MTPEVVLERYGVVPAVYPELAALVGETSDNLPGVPGVGAKTAAKWLDAYGGLDGVIAQAGSIKGKAGESLREHLEDVIRNRRLNRLVDDLELPVTLDDLQLRGWDRDEVHQVFDGLEFRVLRDRLFATLSTPEPEGEGGFDLATTRLDGAAVAEWLTAHAQTTTGVQVTGHAARGSGDARGIALATGDGSAAWVDLVSVAPVGLTALAEWLADPQRPKVMHDAKPALLMLGARGLPLAGLTSDTALAAYLCYPDQRSFDLADLAVRHLGRELRAEDGPAPAVEQLTLDTGDGPDEAEQAMVRSRAVLELAEVLDGELAARGGSALLADLELPLHRVLVGMEQAGVAVDVPALSALEAYFAREVETAAELAFGVIGSRDQPGLAQAAAGRAVRRARACPRPSAPRPATPPTPRRCRTSTPRPSTRSCCICCATATPRSCG